MPMYMDRHDVADATAEDADEPVPLFELAWTA
jgi:hypothetical protein